LTKFKGQGHRERKCEHRRSPIYMWRRDRFNVKPKRRGHSDLQPILNVIQRTSSAEMRTFCG